MGENIQKSLEIISSQLENIVLDQARIKDRLSDLERKCSEDDSLQRLFGENTHVTAGQNQGRSSENTHSQGAASTERQQQDHRA